MAAAPAKESGLQVFLRTPPPAWLRASIWVDGQPDRAEAMEAVHDLCRLDEEAQHDYVQRLVDASEANARVSAQLASSKGLLVKNGFVEGYADDVPPRPASVCSSVGMDDSTVRV